MIMALDHTNWTTLRIKGLDRCDEIIEGRSNSHYSIIIVIIPIFIGVLYVTICYLLLSVHRLLRVCLYMTYALPHKLTFPLPQSQV